jgi:hypothetical protein
MNTRKTIDVSFTGHVGEPSWCFCFVALLLLPLLCDCVRMNVAMTIVVRRVVWLA